MKVKNLIKDLKQFDKNANIVISSDEEWNIVFEGFQVEQLDDEEIIVIYPLSGSEMKF